MTTSATGPNHFVTVDLRGLKAALVAHAQAQRVSVSVLVRAAVARELGCPEPRERDGADPFGPAVASRLARPDVKLSIRMTADEALQLAVGARAAGLSRGAYLAGLISHVPVLTASGNRANHIRALIESNAELATLSRNVYRLTALLRQGDVEPARAYRAMLDTLAGDVRRHLRLAAGALAELQPSRQATTSVARAGGR